MPRSGDTPDYPWHILLLVLLCLSSPRAAAADQTPFIGPSDQSLSNLDYVNPLIGTTGPSATEYGGTIPHPGPPFASVQFTPFTRENHISRRPYHYADERFHGFLATRQPAIWMGDWGYVAVTPGVGRVKPGFGERGMRFGHEEERAEVGGYEVWADFPEKEEDDVEGDEGGTGEETMRAEEVAEERGHGAGQPRRGKRLHAELSATSRAGVMRLTWVGRNTSHTDTRPPSDPPILLHPLQESLGGQHHLPTPHPPKHPKHPLTPWILIQATRANVKGHISIHPHSRTITGWNPDRQDAHLGPFRAPGFKGYFCAKFSERFEEWGSATGGSEAEGGNIWRGRTHHTAEHISAWVRFSPNVEKVEVRLGTSLISVEQACDNLEAEIPEAWAREGRALERVREKTRAEWEAKLGRVTLQGGTRAAKEVFFTAMYHALQYPSEMHEGASYYSGFLDRVVTPPSPISSPPCPTCPEPAAYTGFSTWDIFRAQWSFLLLFAPERVGGMVRSMLQSFDEGGWLPIWMNLVETNIMVGTHSDSLIAQALIYNLTGFDRQKAFQAVWKNAMTPPERDTNLTWYDRQVGTPVEARAGLTYYKKLGYVPSDRTAESGSRTLDYAYDDHCASVVASLTGHQEEAALLRARSQSYRNLWHDRAGFMNSRRSDGSWGWDWDGWTEGDKWKYSFSVMHDIPGLVELMGRDRFVELLTSYWVGGHNQHDNEPSHHIPYLYDYLGGNMTSRTQRLVREVAGREYGAGEGGLSGNEDCGQMSAWYVLSALGVYPVNPAGEEWAVGSPFFDRAVLDLPGIPGAEGRMGQERRMIIASPGAGGSERERGKVYVKSLSVDGKRVERPFVGLREWWGAERVWFEMSDVPVAWG